MIRTNDLRKRLGEREILAGVTVEVLRGELFCLVGASGSGKSTLLRCLAGLETANSGSIAFEDGAPSRVGMVFQEFHLFPHRTALDNVSLAPQVVLREPADAARARGRELLARVGLAGFEHRYPGALSGGQRQRVAIARALAMRPAVLLYDEPTSALDPTLVGEVASLLRSLKSDGLTQIVVTHEMRFAREAADRVGFLKSGLMVRCGAPREVLEEAFGAAGQ